MFQIRKAERRKAKLRLALTGVSGSGKTHSALQLAFGLGGKIGVIDTENSANLYEHLGDYYVISLSAPYTVERYLGALSAFENEGYDTIIVDSLSHAWAGEGGLLDKHGKLASMSAKGDSFGAWRHVTPDHNKLVQRLLSSPSHLIVTMRSKTEYGLQSDGKGKLQPKKIGLAPVQREGLDYEFTVVLDLDKETHLATTSKDRTGLFDDKIEKITVETGGKLLKWLEQGAEPLPPMRITRDQATLLRDLITETDTDEAVVKQWAKISALEELSPQKYEEITLRLSQKQAQAA